MNKSLKTVRENLGLTQAETSALIGIPLNTLRNWEQETRKPSEWTLNLIIDRLLREYMEEMNYIDESNGILSYLQIKKIVTEVAKKYDVESISLFGSYAKGEAKENSDVDLFIESSISGLEYFELVEELRENLRKRVEVFSNLTIDKDSKMYQEIKKTGLLIYKL